MTLKVSVQLNFFLKKTSIVFVFSRFEGAFLQFGVTSFGGVGCVGPLPDVYISVPLAADFIHRVTGTYLACSDFLKHNHC